MFSCTYVAVYFSALNHDAKYVISLFISPNRDKSSIQFAVYLVVITGFVPTIVEAFLTMLNFGDTACKDLFPAASSATPASILMYLFTPTLPLIFARVITADFTPLTFTDTFAVNPTKAILLFIKLTSVTFILSENVTLYLTVPPEYTDLGFATPIFTTGFIVSSFPGIGSGTTTVFSFIVNLAELAAFVLFPVAS